MGSMRCCVSLDFWGALLDWGVRTRLAWLIYPIRSDRSSKLEESAHSYRQNLPHGTCLILMAPVLVRHFLLYCACSRGHVRSVCKSICWTSCQVISGHSRRSGVIGGEICDFNWQLFSWHLGLKRVKRGASIDYCITITVFHLFF